MLCGYPPFWGKTDQEIYEKVKEGTVEFYNEDWDHISDDAKDLIRKMLTYKPSERISTAEAYAHPWIAHNVHVEPLDDKIMRKLATFTARNKIGVAFMQLIAT
jgi:calcium-dependent protein kinase